MAGVVYYFLYYQPAGKTIKIYKDALYDYYNENYQNSYYLFSKIEPFSILKPVAIYRQAMCAKALGDNKSLLRSYDYLYRRFPTNKLAIESRYQAGILLKHDNPELAKTYFEDVINSKKAEEDYVVASKFHVAGILEKTNNTEKVEDIKDFYAHYLEKYPNEKFSDLAATSLEKYQPNLSSKYSTYIAKTYYLLQRYKNAAILFPQTSLQDSWAIQALNSAAMDNPSKSLFLTELGVAHYSDTVEEDDFKSAINKYIEINRNDKYKAISKLFKISKGNRKDYIWYLKCNYSPKEEKAACFEELTREFPKSDYTQIILEGLFFAHIAQKKYEDAFDVGKSYVTHFDNPKVMFWLGKVARNANKEQDAQKYFKEVLKKYPDSYWAYRAHLLTDGNLPKDIYYKPVKYPYRKEHDGKLIKTLEELGDYEMISKISKDDFVKSWALYKQGKYTSSVLKAREAMDKLKHKPPKNDYRWRLVYPMHYFDFIERYSRKYENSAALIYGIMRTESYFDEKAGSSVGARGLMQLMVPTASETASRAGIPFKADDLYDPEKNINLGNLYFSQLRKMLDNRDISSVAAYNGGVGSVLKWQKELNYDDSDEFVELIPYPETKAYVKKVLKSYWNYSRIYDE